MIKFKVGDRVEYRTGRYTVAEVGWLTLKLVIVTGGKWLYAGKSECKLVPPTPQPHEPWVPFNKAYVETREDAVALLVTDAIDKCMEK